MGIRGIFIIILLAWAPSLFAQKEDPRPEMQLILSDVRALEKYVVSEPEFIKPENEKTIASALDKLNHHLEALSRRKIFQDDPALRTNVEMITQHMQQTEHYFNTGSKQFARYMLQSSFQMCISCHTRDKSGVELFLNSEIKDNNSMEYGEFLLATRQFTKARNLFERKVADYPGNSLSPVDLRNSLMSLAVLYARVQPDPKRAGKVFGEFVKRRDVPRYLKSDLRAWIADFRNWQKVGVEPKKNASQKELLSMAKNLLRSDDLSLVADFGRKFQVRRLRASVLLHRLLELPGNSPQKGEALYLLGLLYNRLQHQLFFHFDEMYFRTCIQDYQKSKIAQNCYNALERVVLDGYTGSGGTNLPNEVEVDLMRLKRLAY